MSCGLDEVMPVLNLLTARNGDAQVGVASAVSLWYPKDQLSLNQR